MNVAVSSLWLEGKTGLAVVHSVFDRSLNIRIDETLLTLQNPSCPLVPMGARLERPCPFKERGFQPGQPVLLEKRQWSVNDSVFTFFATQKVNLTLPASPHRLDRKQIDMLIGEIKGFCGTYRTRLPHDAAGIYIGEIMEELLRSRHDDAAFYRAACCLIGAGPGLTPSGDDILTGILFALTWYAKTSGRDGLLRATIDAVRDSLHRTTVVAANFLRHATEGRFTENFLTLTKVPDEKQDQALLSLLIPFAEFGHSSGLDSLVGLASGLKLIRDSI